jgi:hypothetical protein
MKRLFIIPVVAVGLLVTLISCNKEEVSDLKPQTTAAHPLDPNNFGYIDRGEGELYFYEDSMTVYTQANANYLKLKPLSLKKYKQGDLLDSVCNPEIAFVFENRGRLSKDKSELWALKPRVAEEYPPFVTINTDYLLTIKLSKMLKGIGFEFNSPYLGTKYGITVRFFNSKLNKVVPNALTSYLAPAGGLLGPQLGSAGGAMLRGIETEMPFDEIRIVFHLGSVSQPPPPGKFDLMLAGFRYKLAE